MLDVYTDGIKIVGASDDECQIRVIGVGGGGGNAASYLFDKSLDNVDFVVCNTDSQALGKCTVFERVLLGEKGLGAGGDAEVGREIAEADKDKIEGLLGSETEMVFIAACMGGGTGTGVAPVVARTAKDRGILTVAVVTLPFSFEGETKRRMAEDGLAKMRESVDSIVVIENDDLLKFYYEDGLDQDVDAAFAKSDEVLASAVRGIVELVTVYTRINLDMADVRSVMTNGGDVIMGVAKACGENRASEAIKKALRSPLVEYCDVKSANKVLLLITYGAKFGMSEFEDVTRPLKSLGFSSGGNLIWGMGQSSELNPDELHVTIVAAGVERREQTEESVVKQIYEDEIKVQEPSPNKGKKFIDISKFDDESFIEMMENSRPGTINA